MKLHAKLELKFGQYTKKFCGIIWDQGSRCTFHSKPSTTCFHNTPQTQAGYTASVLFQKECHPQNHQTPFSFKLFYDHLLFLNDVDSWSRFRDLRVLKAPVLMKNRSSNAMNETASFKALLLELYHYEYC